MSEFGFWPDYSSRLALMESLAYDGNAIIESTANGLNELHEEWEQAKQGKTRWRPTFYPWWRHDGNSLQPPEEWAPEPLLADIGTRYGLSPAQLYWYDQRSREYRHQDQDLFRQEHPSNDVEAFMASSSNAMFDRDYLFGLLEQMDEAAERPLAACGSLRGELHVWREPEPEHQYVVVADPAEGLVPGAEHKSPDYSVAHVYDLRTQEQVASYEERIVPRDFAGDLVAIAIWYNSAALLPENNGKCGGALLEALSNLEYPVVHADSWEGVRTDCNEAGFLLTTPSKRRLDDNLAAAIGDLSRGGDGPTWHDRRTVEQLIHYARLTPTRAGGEGTYHDDHVSCCRLFGEYLANVTPKWTTPPPKAQARRYGGTAVARRR
jgi:hypothetical protein